MACRLIINADDFGLNEGVNEAVARLYDAGVVTSASLMVGGAAARDAIERLPARPGLAVGLHLALVAAPPVLPPASVPRLVDRTGILHEDPVRAGLLYAFRPAFRAEARREMEAQFKAFAALGTPWSHLDTHVHFGLTPGLLPAILATARAYPITGFRVPEDDFALHRRLDPADARRRRPQAAWFAARCRAQRGVLRAAGYRLTSRCYGFFRSGRLDAPYLARLVRALPDGDLELHCHPDLSTEAGRREYEALLSPEFRAALRERGVRPATYASLAAAAEPAAAGAAGSRA